MNVRKSLFAGFAALAALPLITSAQVEEPMASAITFADAQMRATLADMGFGASGTNPDWSTSAPDFPKVTTNDSRNVDWGYQSRTGNWGAGFTPGLMWDLYELTGDAYWLEKADAFTDGMEPTATSGGDMRMNMGFHMMNSYARRIASTGTFGDESIMATAADTLLLSWMPNVGSVWSFSWSRGSRFDGLQGGWSAYANTIIDSAPNIEILLHQAKAEVDPDMWAKALSHLDNLIRDNIRPDGSTAQLSAYDTDTGEFLGNRGHQGYSFESTWSRGQGWAMHGFASAWRETRDPDYGDAFHQLYSFYRQNAPEDGIPYWDFEAPNLTDAELEFRYPDNPDVTSKRYGRDTSAAALAASSLMLAARLAEEDYRAVEYFEYGLHILESLSTPGYLARDGLGNPTKASILAQGSYTFPGIDKGQIWGDFFFVEALRRYRELVEPSSVFNATDTQWGDLANYVLGNFARWSIRDVAGDAALRLQGRENTPGDLPSDLALYRFSELSDFEISLLFGGDELLANGNPVDAVLVFGFRDVENYLFFRLSNTAGRSGLYEVSGGVLNELAPIASTWPNGSGIIHEVTLIRTGDSLVLELNAESWFSDSDPAYGVAGHAGFGGMGKSLYFDGVTASGTATPADLAPREAWRAGHFPEPRSILAQDGFDPDRDGRPNLLEYAFGTDPLVADSGSAGLRMALNNGLLELAFPYNKGHTDLVYRLMRSSDGGSTWEAVQTQSPDGSGGWATSRFLQGLTPGSGGVLYRVEVTSRY